MLKRTARRIRESQWLLLEKLLQRNYSLRDALEFLANSYPENQRIRGLKEAMSSGIPVTEMLGVDSFERELAFYAGHITLEKAIGIVLEAERKRKTRRKDLLGRISYPLTLLVGAILLTMLFSSWVLPTMMRSMDGYEAVTAMARTFGIVSLVRNIIMIMLAALAGLLAYICLFHREVYVWNHLHRTGKDRFIRIVITGRFAGELAALLSRGISMKDSVEVIRFHKKDPMVSLLAHHFDESLLAGISFDQSLQNSWFDPQFHSLCLGGITGADFIRSLEDYQQMVDYRLSEGLKITAVLFQVISYLTVGAVILLAYRVLLLPLESLQGL